MDFIKNLQADVRSKPFTTIEEAQAQNILSEIWCAEIIEVLEKNEKYKWHIRPEGGWTKETAPDTKRFVEVRTEDSFPYYFGWYDTESETDMWYDATGFSMEPYKWRDIEEEVSE